MDTSENKVIDHLLEGYPYLAERAIVNFVNGFDVRRDLGSEKKKLAESGIFSRLLDSVSGKKDARQVMIDQSTEDALIFIKDYIVKNEDRWTENNGFLSEVADGVRQLSGKLQQVDGIVSDIQQTLLVVDKRLMSVEGKLDGQQLFNEAQVEMRHALSIFAQDDVLTAEQGLWFLLNRLKYGSFGVWLKANNNSEQNKQVMTVLSTLRNDCLKIFNDRTRRGAAELIARDDLVAQLAYGEDTVKEALRLTLDRPASDLECLIYSHSYNDAAVDLSDLAFVFSNNSIYDQMALCLTQEMPDARSN